MSASQIDVWCLLATDEGFSRWFPELHLEQKLLVFEMEDFREEMAMLAYDEGHQIAYAWDRARVSFSLQKAGAGTQILFEEIIPKDFGNDFADVSKDMTGWLVQNEIIRSILDNQKSLDRALLQDKWSAFIAQEIKRLEQKDFDFWNQLLLSLIDS